MTRQRAEQRERTQFFDCIFKLLNQYTLKLDVLYKLITCLEAVGDKFPATAGHLPTHTTPQGGRPCTQIELEVTPQFPTAPEWHEIATKSHLYNLRNLAERGLVDLAARRGDTAA